MNRLVIQVTFLNGSFHGRFDGKNPEWPPSPFRLFQAMVAVSSSLDSDLAQAEEALRWVSHLTPPAICTPPTKVGSPFQISVPNNAMDIVGKSWARGNYNSKDAQPSTHKAMKTIRPTFINELKDASPIYFCWHVDSEESLTRHLPLLQRLASYVCTVGWGIDQVAIAVHSMTPEQASNLPGERWIAGSASGRNVLRCPTPNALPQLQARYRQTLNRLSKGNLTMVSPLPQNAYQRVPYQRENEKAAPPIAAFSFLDLDGAKMRAFRSTRSCHVAAMLRHAMADAAQTAGWDPKTIDTFVLGHGEERSAQTEHIPVGLQRLSYVPLPSLERRQSDGPANHVGLIRRALLHVPAGGHKDEVDRVRRMLAGFELIDEHKQDPVAFLAPLPNSDKVIGRYIQTSACWASVTPVILPGRDDRRAAKTEKLLRKTIVQAGFPKPLADTARLDWSKTGFWPGTEHVSQYFIPKHLRDFPAFHVRLSWTDENDKPLEIPGPIVLGGGRYYGLGLLASEQ